MRALRYYGQKDIRVDHDVAEPTCQPHQIKVKPAFVGICGTDLHEYSNPSFIPAKGSPHPVTGEEMPVGLGHEFSGTVVEIGSKVTGPSVKVGDKVAVQPTICCRACGPCGDGYLNCCDTAGFIGLSGGGGGLSDFVCADADFVFKLPENVPLDIGALVEPLAVAWHAVSSAGPLSPSTDDTNTDDLAVSSSATSSPSSSALVLGAGPIGLGVIQCLKARGYDLVVVAEVARERQNFARHFGASHVFDPTKDDVVAKCKELTGGRGVHVALDCAGLAATVKTAALAVRAKGKIVNVAIWEKEAPIQPNLFVFGEKTYSGVLGYQTPDFAGVISALADASIRPEKMITSKIAIDRIVEDGFTALIEEKDKHVKILVDLSL